MNRDTGEIETLVDVGRRQAADSSAQRRRIVGRHNLFHRVDRPSSASSTSRARSSRRAATAVAVPARPRRHGHHACVDRAVLRQRGDARPRTSRRWCSPRPRRAAVEVLADRAEGRHRDAVGRATCPGMPDNISTGPDGRIWVRDGRRRATPSSSGWRRGPRSCASCCGGCPTGCSRRSSAGGVGGRVRPRRPARAVAGVHTTHPRLRARHRARGARRPGVAGHASEHRRSPTASLPTLTIASIATPVTARLRGFRRGNRLICRLDGDLERLCRDALPRWPRRCALVGTPAIACGRAQRRPPTPTPARTRWRRRLPSTPRRCPRPATRPRRCRYRPSRSAATRCPAAASSSRPAPRRCPATSRPRRGWSPTSTPATSSPPATRTAGTARPASSRC